MIKICTAIGFTTIIPGSFDENKGNEKYFSGIKYNHDFCMYYVLLLSFIQTNGWLAEGPQ